MKRSTAYLGTFASVILGGILGLIASVVAFDVLDTDAGFVHMLIVIALGAFIGGALAVIRVRRYMKIEKQFAKYLTLVPKNAGNLIKAIIGEMRYRKKVQGDVMFELVAHFEDELKNCPTAEEKKQKAQQLIEDFGDVKLLGILLRRAKKRCRPLWRTMLARTFQTIGILILSLVIYMAWFLSGKPVITTDYVAELNRLVRPAADDSLNAAPLYRKAAELYERLPEDISELLGKKYDEATDEEKQLVEKWLVENKEILDLVIAGTQKPYYWQEYAAPNDTKEVISISIPNFASFRRLAYTLRWWASLNAEQGAYTDAMADIRTCYRFGRHLKGDKTLVEQLVGIAIEAIAVKTMREILSQYQINSAELAKLQSDFEQMVAGEDFAMSLKAEKLCVYDEIQRCFTEDRLGGGHLYLPRLTSLGCLNEVSGKVGPDQTFGEFLRDVVNVFFVHPNKEETRKMVDSYLVLWEQISLKTPGQIRTDNIDLGKEQTYFTKNMFLRLLTPVLKRMHEISYQLPTDVNATLTIIAILRYKQDTGGYPENLDELITAGYIRELPMDFFSDRPLVYKRTDDDFVLYSVGHNFTDDGGQAGEDKKGRVKVWAYEGDAVFWPVRK